ncbi:MAG TPA: ABC transporter ATP-binding protein [Thermodesulfobacteriota bacterium]|nr:ABC transporter ATP-binding protein [Thermodesulfobacteriota bacterium]
MTELLLEGREVTKDFGGLQAVGDVSFGIRKGEIFSVIGPNGAGKTTLFNLITGFLRPTRGEIFFKGERISGLKPFQVARRGASRTFQLTTLFEKNTVLENLMIGQAATREMGVLRTLFGGQAKRSAEKRTLEEAHRLAEFVGLGKEKATPAGLLPQRAQKQLSIGLAFAGGPELLLLDEPAGGVNLEEVGVLIDLISRIRKSGVTVCLIEHKMSVVMNISDRILALNYGRKVTEGTPAEVCRNDQVIKSYLGEKYAAR